MPTKNPQEPFSRLNVQEAKDMLDKGDIELIDVREPHEFNSGHLPGARLIPLATIPNHASELDDGRPILFVCGVGQRSALAAEYAAAAGKTNLYNIDGGTEGWLKSGYPVEK
ncbi:MAG TPA: rhodanese-like domain-containing protein [Dehalococcoidia bacterium]|nr:rhodanese-like domain-containing protein [Dehalococcoidia bacterium]